VNWSADDVEDVPIRVVTVMSTVPAVSAGLTAVIWVEELTVKLAAAVVPNSTPVAPVRLEPVMTTVVPPAVVPTVGVTPDTVGAAWYVNWSAEDVAEVPEAVTTVMSMVAADSAGDTAVMEVTESTV
jgi:hypothetical protein